MLSSYKLILFDLDNTLLDYNTAETKAFKETFIKFSMKGSIHSTHKIYQKCNHYLWHQYENNKISSQDLKLKRWQMTLDELRMDYSKTKNISSYYLEQLIKHTEPIPYALKVCLQLAKNAKLIAVTNGFTKIQEQRLKKNKLESYFTHLVTSEDLGISKPHLEIFSHAHSFYPTIPKEKIIMIGDSLKTDILGAHNYGIDSCLLSLEENNKENSIKPTYIINSLEELL